MTWCNLSVYKPLFFDIFCKFFALAWWAIVCLVRFYYSKHSKSLLLLFGITAPAYVLYMYYFYYGAILNNHPPLQYAILTCVILSTEFHEYIFPQSRNISHKISMPSEIHFIVFKLHILWVKWSLVNISSHEQNGIISRLRIWKDVSKMLWNKPFCCQMLE